jgi:hypothetical protein
MYNEMLHVISRSLAVIDLNAIVTEGDYAIIISAHHELQLISYS